MANRDGDRATRRRIIERPRLLRLLDEAEARIILLVAPAGYGKTTLARQWASTGNRRTVTYRPVASAPEAVTIASALAARADEILPGSGDALRSRLSVSTLPPIGPVEMAEILAERLAPWPPEAWLIIEDVQLLAADAARFVERLISTAAANFMLTARVRPSWITSRQIVYFEISEIDRALLAFDRDETAALLAGATDEASNKLYELSGGWPAVIGLAALSPHLIPRPDTVPSALYEFFADELYHGTPQQLRDALHALVPAPDIHADLLRHLFGEAAPGVAHAATAAGFLNSLGDGSFELHRLLRPLLLRKARETDAGDLERAAVKVARFYLSNLDFENAAETIRRFGLRKLVPPLLQGVLSTSASEGRGAALDAALRLARRWNVSTATRELAEGEHAFRHGNYEYAAARLAVAIQELPRRSPHLSHGAYRLGQAYQFLSRTEEAMSAHRVAEANATTADARRSALWGLFTLACETTGEDLEQYVAAFHECGPLGSDDLLRLANARIALALRSGDVAAAIREFNEALPQLQLGKNPMIQTSLLNYMAGVFTVAARYSDALSICAQELRTAKYFRLDFVVPHALLNRAGTFIAMRRQPQAARTIVAAERHFGPSRDAFAETNLVIVRAKLAVAESRLSDARGLLERRVAAPTGTTLDAEVTSLLALIAAASGDLSASSEWSSAARSLFSTHETRLTASWADIIAACSGESSTPAAAELFAETVASQFLEPFVVAYRACPPLLGVIATGRLERLAELRHVLAKTRDVTLLENHASAGGIAGLSPRELDVSALLAQGMTNRQIADALSISEVTVKVHVRRVLAKLGARSRTQAALKLTKG